MKVESICIVGGGSAGWMSAALLAKQFPDIEIALVESDKKPTIGVGEKYVGALQSLPPPHGVRG